MIGKRSLAQHASPARRAMSTSAKPQRTFATANGGAWPCPNACQASRRRVIVGHRASLGTGVLPPSGSGSSIPNTVRNCASRTATRLHPSILRFGTFRDARVDGWLHVGGWEEDAGVAPLVYRPRRSALRNRVTAAGMATHLSHGGDGAGRLGGGTAVGASTHGRTTERGARREVAHGLRHDLWSLHCRLTWSSAR
jgi:hypothetical protein